MKAHSTWPIRKLSPLPKPFSYLSDPPHSIFLKGNASLLGEPAIAIVGSRKGSAYGLSAAFRFAYALAIRGWVIVSGLARGIDTAAHRGALQANGKTVAVLGHGLDQVYPRENTKLAEEILESKGALLSEYPEGTPPLPYHFPKRNRLISGLSLGVLIVEARPRSGSLITARCALEQGREVFVLPAHYNEGSFEGGLRYIQQGAKLVLSPEDLLEEFSDVQQVLTKLPKTRRLSESLAQIKSEFDKKPKVLSLNELASGTGLTLGALNRSIEEGLQSGFLAEVGPQQFLWIKT